MAKFTAILAVGLLAILILFPSNTHAQPGVCIFYGTVRVDGHPIEDGTKITAWTNGEKVASSTTYTKIENQQAVPSSYILTINSAGKSYNGKTFAFTIGDQLQPATEVVIFKNGGNIELDLTSYCTNCHEPGYLEIELIPNEGTITNVCGEVSPPNLPVTIYFDQEPYSTASPDPKGRFCTPVIPPISKSGQYIITATSVWGKEVKEPFIIRTPTLGSAELQSKPGIQGPPGLPGEQGPPGEKGNDADITLSILGLIMAIGAVIVVLVIGYPSKQKDLTSPIDD